MEKLIKDQNAVNEVASIVSTEEEKMRVFYKQKERCAICLEPMLLVDGEADHIEEHSLGNPSDEKNCQILCRPCHKEKTKNFMKKEEVLETVE